MPKSAAQKCREYRERLKQSGKYEESKAKDRLQKKRKRLEMKGKLTIRQQNIRRAKDRARQQKHRRKLLALSSVMITPGPSSSPAFKTRQSFGKAFKKVASALPKSPRKARALVRRLAEEKAFSAIASPPKKHKASLEDESETLIKNFYCRDDISRVAPGKKDYVIIRDRENGKEKVQKRNLLMTIKEAYFVFKSEYPTIVVGKSKFFSLRPKVDLPLSELSQNVCLCKYHENFNLLLVACCDMGLPITKCTSDFVTKVVCSDSNVDCMLTGKCSVCGSCKLFDEHVASFDNDILAEHTTWYQWQAEETRTVKNVHEGTLSDALAELRKQLVSFLAHVFVKRRQSECFEKCKNSVSEKCALIQVDFSENYLSQYQDEVQSAHWHYNQVTVFTCVVWVGKTSISYAIISDYLSHDKFAVYQYLKVILDDLKITHPQVENVIFFSDGAASQFKQKFLFINLTFLRDDYGYSEFTWNFFATSHGKGAVDGIGGCVKRLVWTRVLSGKAVVKDAQSFFTCAEAAQSKTKIKLVVSSEIEAVKEQLEKRWDGCKSLPQTQNVHFVKVERPYVVTSKRFSASNESVCFNFKEGIEICSEQDAEEVATDILVNVHHNNLVVGMYVIVQFVSKRKQVKYVGLIENVDGQDIEVFFLKKQSDKVYVRPARDDKCWVSRDDVIQVLKPPTIDNRGHFTFDEVINSK